MPTTLPQAAIKFHFDEATGSEPSYVTLFLSVALTLIVPPVLLLLTAAAIAGHGEVSLASVGTAFEAAGKAQLCLEAHDCKSIDMPSD